MADNNLTRNYDDALSSMLVNEKSILGFLSAIFNFLARRTDFYYVPENQNENIGFPAGVAEELVLKVLRSCDPKIWKPPNSALPTDVNNEIMCSTVAQEVEVIADEDNIEHVDDGPEICGIDNITQENVSNTQDSSPDTETNKKIITKSLTPDDYKPPVIPVQKNSESYNGAVRDNYIWSQTIMELDIIVNLPSNVKSSKELKVTINPSDICVACSNGDVIVKDKLPYKIKAIDSFWSFSEGRLLVHLEKFQERWWNRFLDKEEPIDLSKIDCSRPLNELPEDHIAKVRELQWNQEQKLKGFPTSDEIRNLEILNKAWNAPGSPFQGTQFDPSVLRQQ